MTKKEDIKNAKKDLKSAMRKSVRHQVNDLGRGIITIATGEKYSVKIKILGYYKPRK